MFRFKFPKQFYYLSAIFMAVFLLGLTGALRPVRGLAEKILIVPVRQKVFDWQRLLKKDLKSCEIKNEKDIFELKAKVAVLEEENRQQKRLLSSPLPKNWTFLTTKVIGVENETLVINSGKEEKIKEGMIVILDNIYLGKIFSVSEKMSFVRLATFPEEKLTALLFPEKGDYPQGRGLLVGNGLGRMKVEQILQTERVEKNDLVLTETDGGRLLVGVVDDVQSGKNEMFKSVSVKRLFNPEELGTIFVVLGKI